MRGWGDRRRVVNQPSSLRIADKVNQRTGERFVLVGLEGGYLSHGHSVVLLTDGQGDCRRFNGVVGTIVAVPGEAYLTGEMVGRFKRKLIQVRDRDLVARLHGYAIE